MLGHTQQQDARARFVHGQAHVGYGHLIAGPGHLEQDLHLVPLPLMGGKRPKTGNELAYGHDRSPVGCGSPVKTQSFGYFVVADGFKGLFLLAHGYRQMAQPALDQGAQVVVEVLCGHGRSPVGCGLLAPNQDDAVFLLVGVVYGKGRKSRDAFGFHGRTAPVLTEQIVDGAGYSVMDVLPQVIPQVDAVGRGVEPLDQGEELVIGGGRQSQAGRGRRLGHGRSPVVASSAAIRPHAYTVHKYLTRQALCVKAQGISTGAGGCQPLTGSARYGKRSRLHGAPQQVPTHRDGERKSWVPSRIRSETT